MRKKLVFVLLMVVAGFLPTSMTSALTTTELYNNAANNIFFYVKGDDACNPSTLAEYVATVTGDQITWIGDAYSVFARLIIETKYPGVSIFAENGRNFSVAGGTESGIDVAKRLAGGGALRKYVVFMLGTNGGDNKSEEEVKTMISDLISVVGEDRMIVLMTPYTRTRKYENFGKVVKETAKSNEKVLVADWAAAAKDKIDDYFEEDKDSMTEKGLNALVAVVAATLDKYTESKKKNATSTVGASLTGSVNVTTSSGTDQNALTIAQWLRGAGYDGDAIAAILGNLQGESSIIPNKLEGGKLVTDPNWKIKNWEKYGKKGFGIAQWTTSGRQNKLQAFADLKALPIISLEAQGGYLIEELKISNYKSRVEDINGKGIAYATYMFWRYFETPGASFWTTHNGTYYNSCAPTGLDSGSCPLSESRTPAAYKSYTKRLGYAKHFLELIEQNGIAQGSGITWDGSGSSSSSNGAVCSTNLQGGKSLAQLAVDMAWPNQADGTCLDENGGVHDFKNEKSSCKSGIKAKNKEVVQSVYGAGANLLSKMQDCSHFVYAAIQYSGLDKNWKDGSTPAWEYAQGKGKSLWTEIENKGNTSNLMPGDVFIYPHIGDHYGHVMIYVGEYGGKYGDMAGASAPDTVARVHNAYFTHTDTGAGSNFKIFRYSGSSAEDSSTPAGNCSYNSVNAEGCIIYSQSDSPWGSTSYGTGSSCSKYSSAGCAPTVYAMVIANLTGNSSITPKTIGDKAVSIGARSCGGGTNGSKIVGVVKDYGLNYEKISFSENSINQALSQGKIVVLSASGSPPFSSNGHFVAVRGKTSSGKWLLFNNRSGSKKEYTPSAFINAAGGKANSGPYAIWK